LQLDVSFARLAARKNLSSLKLRADGLRPIYDQALGYKR